MVEKKLIIDTDTFTDDKGAEHTFVSFKTELMEKEIRLFPQQVDKKLAIYLAEQELAKGVEKK